MKTTIKDLEAQVNRLNIMTDSPRKPYEIVDGKWVSQPNNFHLDGAYGGWKLCRICPDGKGSSDVLSCGYVTKRELSQLISAYERGLESK